MSFTALRILLSEKPNPMNSVRTLLTRIVLSAWILLLFTLPARSQTPKEWTLEDCINYALDNNLDIKKQVLGVESNRANLLESYLVMLPNLNAYGSNTWNWGQTIDMYTNTFATSEVRSNNFYISTGVTLFNGMTKYNAVKQSQINLLASKYDLDVLKDNISLAVAGYFLDILFKMELLDVANRQLEITQSQVKRMEKLVEAGSTAKGDLLNIQAQESSDQLTVINAQNQLTISKITLQQLIDLPVTKDFEIQKPLLKDVERPKDLMTPEQMFGIAVDVRPEIKSADLRVQSAIRTLYIARGRITPTLSFSGSWGTGYSGAAEEIDPNVPSTTTWYPAGITQSSHDTVLIPQRSYTYRTKSFWDQLKDNNNKSIGFSLQVPIFNGWQGRTAITQAKIQRNQAELDLEIQKRNLRKSIEQAYADAVASFQKYNSSIQKVKAQEESFKYTQQKFDVGMLTAFDFNNSKKDLTVAQSDLIQAKYDFIFKTTILDFYMGKPISINK
jgi:outer membrane protein